MGKKPTPLFPLTMQQEARNTESHLSSNSHPSNAKLRNNKVSFVSGGNMQLDESNEISPHDSDRDESAHHIPATAIPSDSGDSKLPLEENNIFYIDVKGEASANPASGTFSSTHYRSPSSSDSSGDEVVFPGRNKGHGNLYERTTRHRGTPHMPISDTMVSVRTAIIDEDFVATGRSLPTNHIRHRETKKTESAEIAPDLVEFNKGLPKYFKGRRKRITVDDEDAILADYIANMDKESSNSSSQSPSIDSPRHSPELANNNKPPPADMKDLERIHISDEPSLDIGQIHTKMSKRIDTQYPVAVKAETPGYTPRKSQEMPMEPDSNERLRNREGDVRSGSLPENCEEGEPYVPANGASSDDLDQNAQSTGDSSEESSANDGHDNWGDISDEMLDSDTLNDLLLDAQRQASITQRRKNKRSNKSFPSATALADALDLEGYAGFDIMDFDRPSLRKKPKGRSLVGHLELSDSDLELDLEAAWKNDRTKKKARKQQRDQLRSQGLLGRKPGKPDLQIKYKSGMSIDHVKSELRDFLLSPAENLNLPPMDKKLRKVVHELANAIPLKSQSRGKGSGRFPVLYKTSRTPHFTERTIAKIDGVFAGRRFKDPSGNRKASKLSNKVGRTRPNVAASYMDGDVVGGSAPEIGADNKGRAMLEKMGWSTGTALGALNNKGILQPVAHIVKNSRTGLG